jgi:hypothetical protein
LIIVFRTLSIENHVYNYSQRLYPERLGFLLQGDYLPFFAWVLFTSRRGVLGFIKESFRAGRFVHEGFHVNEVSVIPAQTGNS